MSTSAARYRGLKRYIDYLRGPDRLSPADAGQRPGRAAADQVTGEEATDLLHLRGLWQQAYAITVTGSTWTARRHDDPARVLTADTAAGLRWQIRTDYGEWLRARA